MSRRPRLGFLGVGWIGRDRMRAIAESGVAEICLVADNDAGAAAQAAAEIGGRVVTSAELLDEAEVDGIVIATPSALHADQSITALKRGLAVFCQKPLGRNAGEVADVVAAAVAADRSLSVDLSYRHLRATAAMKELIGSGRIGDVYAANLVFHNAYGPDKPWFLDPELSGGGCVIDLGTHLVDLVTWMLPGESLELTSARRFAGGTRLGAGARTIEDFAVAGFDMSSGGSVTMACSWFLHAGCDAVIGATFHGTNGSVSLHNVGGSFYDFRAVLDVGTERSEIVSPPDAWGGRAAVAWATRLAASLDDADPSGGVAARDGDLGDLVSNAALIDAIYAR